MWSRVADSIIRFRLLLMGVIAIITAIMGFYATKVEMSYDFTRSVPPNDPDMVFLDKFREQFGEDGNIIAIGFKDSAIYKLDNFQKFRKLNDELRKIEGVNDVLSLPVLKILLKDTTNNKFYLSPIFPPSISSQQELDSLLMEAKKQKLYMGILVNSGNGATMMVVSVKKG